MSSESDLREYAGRDWQVIEAQGRDHWAERYRQFGSLEKMRAASTIEGRTWTASRRRKCSAGAAGVS